MRNLGNIFNEFYDCAGEIFRHMYCNLILTSFNLSTLSFSALFYVLMFTGFLFYHKYLADIYLNSALIFFPACLFLKFSSLNMRVSNIEL